METYLVCASSGEPRAEASSPEFPTGLSSSVETGLVVYELVQVNWVDGNGQFWDRLTLAAGLHRSDGSRVMGTVLMQLLADRRLMVEVFMGKSASQVTGFTNAALVYER